MTFSRFMRLLAAGLVAVTLAVSHAAGASSSEGGGQVGNPSKLRAGRESHPSGRSMKRPSIPDPEERLPLRSTALIPNPQPSSRGGSGYQRNGKYFYATPRDIELKRTKAGSGYEPTIPRPEPLGLEHHAKSRTSSSSHRSSTSSSHNDPYSTGSLGKYEK